MSNNWRLSAHQDEPIVAGARCQSTARATRRSEPRPTEASCDTVCVCRALSVCVCVSMFISMCMYECACVSVPEQTETRSWAGHELRDDWLSRPPYTHARTHARQQAHTHTHVHLPVGIGAHTAMHTRRALAACTNTNQAGTGRTGSSRCAACSGSVRSASAGSRSSAGRRAGRWLRDWRPTPGRRSYVCPGVGRRRASCALAGARRSFDRRSARGTPLHWPKEKKKKTYQESQAVESRLLPVSEAP